jgi:23S rRNA (cytosine1962-C5)-methyltransferase
MPEIYIKVDREKSIIKRHPWIFSGTIDKVAGNPKIGETVDVLSANGEFLARASYNPNSSIAGRIWTWDESEQISTNLFHDRLNKAITCRWKIKDLIQSDAVRMVNAESDNLPGLILDRYQDTYVIQFLTAGVEYWKSIIIDCVLDITHAKILYERSDVDIRQLEGLPLRNGLLHGKLTENKVVITENDLKFSVDIIAGHKTGFYLDQRDNRMITQKISAGLNVLDCFAYSGGFGLNALYGNANSITLVDSSGTALSQAKENLILNNLTTENVTFIEQDIFKYLRTLRDSGKVFDMIILDPPKFAPTSSNAEQAARGYKDINLLAFKILNPGGILITFSCSGGVSEEFFQKIVYGAALDAKAEAVILKRLHQAPDHPVALNYPESAYLKGFIIRKHT